MALIAVYATPRRRRPRPGAWAPAQIDYRMITEVLRDDVDTLEVALTGGFSVGTWLMPSPTPAAPS